MRRRASFRPLNKVWLIRLVIEAPLYAYYSPMINRDRFQDADLLVSFLTEAWLCVSFHCVPSFLRATVSADIML